MSAGGRPFCRQTHWTNPQFLVRLVSADEDEDLLSTLIVCLMQKDTRRLRHLGAQLLAVGFAIYRVSCALWVASVLKTAIRSSTGNRYLGF